MFACPSLGGSVHVAGTFGTVARPEPTLIEAFALQQAQCEALGSHQYAQLLGDLGAEVARGGDLADLLAERGGRPLRDALALRLLGAVHRIVLRGGAPQLAARYQSAGGDGGAIAVGDVLQVVRDHRAEVAEALGQQVQTNEVGRSAVLVAGLAAIARRTGRPLALLEIGASAGLNLNWQHYWFASGTTSVGDANSSVRFDDVWSRPADLSGLDGVVSAIGCDMAPIDVSDDAGRQRLLSFVWPDQEERFRRLSAALDIAERHPPVVERADAAEWLAEQLAGRPDGVCTVVFHSIVWQYLAPSTQEEIRSLLAAHGARATDGSPLAWLRMEPAGPVADVRVTLWPGGSSHEPHAAGADEIILGTAGYHGADISISTGIDGGDR